MGFQLHARDVGQVTVIDAAGRLTLTDGHTKLRDLIHVSTGYGAKKFVLNLAGVEYVDSYGIGELARCHSVIRQAGAEVKLAGVREKILELLAMTKLNTVFEIYPTEEDALRVFRQKN